MGGQHAAALFTWGISKVVGAAGVRSRKFYLARSGGTGLQARTLARTTHLSHRLTS